MTQPVVIETTFTPTVVDVDAPVTGDTVQVTVSNVPGPVGPTNSLDIGTVTTLPPGGTATAGITGTPPMQTLNLGIPQGPAGVVQDVASPGGTLTVGGTTAHPSLDVVFGSAAGTAMQGNDPRGSDSRTPTGSAGSTSDVQGSYPTGLLVKKINGVPVTGTPTLGMSIVATSPTAASWQLPPTLTAPIRITAKSGEFYLPMNPSGSGTNNTLGFLALTPIWIPVACTAITLAIVSSTPNGGSVGRIGLYSPDATGRPGALLLDAGTVSLASGTGTKTITVSQALPAGVIWVTAVVQSVASALTTISLNMSIGIPLLSGLALSSAPTYVGPFIHATTAGGSTASTVSGALPSTLTLGIAATTTVAPLVGIGI